MDIQVSSKSFLNNQTIPSRYTCDGENISPPLVWSEVPDKTRSIAIICDDPDAPSGDWVHWLIYNIDPNINELPENIPLKRIIDGNTRQGINDFGKTGYGGPCPPSGNHRYFFRLFALDTVLDLKENAKKKDLLNAMKNHVVAEGELIGLYAGK